MTMPRQIVLASGNAGKLRELRTMLADTGIEVLALRDFPPVAEPDEPYDTFEGNARHKARYYWQMLSLSPAQFVLADDSGLCVDALGGAPGVYSARYAGEPRSDERNNHKVLEQMALRTNPSERRAHFTCVLALVGDGIERCYHGQVDGRLAAGMSGSRGFGYDVMFIPDGHRHTFGELDDVVKAQISHRSRALARLLEDIRTWRT